MTLEQRARIVRSTAVAFQLVAVGLVGTALYGVLWSVADALGKPEVGLDYWSLMEVVVLVGLIVVAFVGLRRWLRGGPPTLLYGFDALPLLFIVLTAGPGALQTPLGLLLAAAFLVPALLTWAASGGGGRAA